MEETEKERHATKSHRVESNLWPLQRGRSLCTWGTYVKYRGFTYSMCMYECVLSSIPAKLWWKQHFKLKTASYKHFNPKILTCSFKISQEENERGGKDLIQDKHMKNIKACCKFLFFLCFNFPFFLFLFRQKNLFCFVNNGDKKKRTKTYYMQTLIGLHLGFCTSFHHFFFSNVSY